MQARYPVHREFGTELEAAVLPGSLVLGGYHAGCIGVATIKAPFGCNDEIAVFYFYVIRTVELQLTISETATTQECIPFAFIQPAPGELIVPDQRISFWSLYTLAGTTSEQQNTNADCCHQPQQSS